MRISWIVQNLILSMLLMMVFSKKFFKTSKTDNNTSIHLMESLPLTTEASQSAILRKGRLIGDWSAPEFV